jgi:hypothetical protein
LARGDLVGPGVPSVLTDGRTPFVTQPPWPGARSTGRRLALARWVARKDHPLTARVMVNRVWKHHFGTGLVSTLDNFGAMGARPTHPELLDWLAVYFVEHGWSVKSLHRLVMTSTAYRQSSQVTDDHLRLDPDNALVSRMPLRRMEGEVLRDSLLRLSGRLDPTQFGPPDPLSASPEGLVTAETDNRPSWRRSIYVLKRRTQPLTILQNFDVAGMEPNCVVRTESIVAPQALHLANNRLVRKLAVSFAERVWNEAGCDPARQVTTAYLLAASRGPSPEESRIARASLAELTEKWAEHDAQAAPRRALEDLCHALFNSAAFLYID